MTDVTAIRRIQRTEQYGMSNNIGVEDFDRRTALRVLNDLSSSMYPNYDLYGNKTLVIDRDKFEAVRAKYLDRRG